MAIVTRVILALTLALGLPPSTAFAQAMLAHVDSAGLEALMARGVPLVDIRTPGEWAETGTITGAHRIMAFDEKGKLSPDFIEKLAQVVKTPADEVALVCRSGNRTVLLGKALVEQLGYANVYNVEKGMKRWLAEGRPVEK